MSPEDPGIEPRTGLPSQRRRVDVEAVTVTVLPTIGIVASELSLYFGSRSGALWGHVVTLLFCVIAPLWFSDHTSVLGALALVSVFRLVNLGMPVFFQLTVYWLPLIYGPLVPALLLVRRSYPDPEHELDWYWLLALGPLATALSVLLAEVEFSIIAPEALIPTWSPLQLLFLTVIMVGFVGFVEELLFRAILQPSLQTRVGRWPGLLLASAVFGLMHSSYGEPVEILFAGGIGLVFGLLYEQTGSVALVTVIHGMLNVFLFAVIPMQGSVLDLLA